jgi:hypothetical protein
MGDHMEMGRPQVDFFGVLWNGPRYLSLERAFQMGRLIYLFVRRLLLKLQELSAKLHLALSCSKRIHVSNMTSTARFSFIFSATSRIFGIFFSVF